MHKLKLSKVVVKIFFIGLVSLMNNIAEAQSKDPIVVGNPIIKDKYTADPSALVYNNTVYLYTGYDEKPAPKEGYEMHEWFMLFFN
ncbi:MAG: hypothetical protein WKG06_30675 [Segetibacter sp.]